MSEMNSRFKTISIILVHSFFWTVYVTYEIVFNVVFPDAYQNFTNHLFFYAANICLFYVHAHLVLPFIFRSRKHIVWRLPLLLFLEILLFLTIIIFDDWLKGNFEMAFNGWPLMFDVTGLQYFVVPLLPYLIYSTGYFFLYRYFESQKQSREAEKRNLQQLITQKELEINFMRVEQDFLRAQINPHFLFNTLSFISYSAKHDAEKADKAISMLSDFMRYSFEPSHQSGLVSLGREIQHVRNLIELNQMRFSGRLNFDFSVDANMKNIQVLPLVLLTLVENIFKHGDLQKNGAKAIVTISLNGSHLIIHAENPVKSSASHVAKSNTGLVNIEKRLDLFYGDRSKFQYHNKNNSFITHLTILLKPIEIGNTHSQIVTVEG